MALLPRGPTGTNREEAQETAEVGLELLSTNTVTAGANAQATAAPLLGSYNVINAGPANGAVLLPGPQLGLTIATFNISGNPINVFGQGSDAINGLAAAASANQMNNSIVWFTCVAVSATGVGTWLAQGLGTGYAPSGNGSFPTYSSIDGLVATVGGNQANATPITTSTAGFNPGAAGTDAARLPPAIAGMEVTVINKSSGNAMIVFPASAAQGGVVGGDAINNQAVNTSLSIAASTVLLFYCLTSGVWWSK